MSSVLPASPGSSLLTSLKKSFDLSISLPKRKAETASLVFFIMMALAVTVFQKFAVDVDFSRFGIPISIGSVEFALPMFYLGLAVLAFWVPFKLNLKRLGLFLLFTVAVMISLGMQKRDFSMNSVLLVFAIYTPFLLHVNVRETTYKSMVAVFLNIMIIAGVIVIIQQVVQLVWSPQLWPNLDKILPDELQFKNFNYIQPITHDSRLMKPNAVFFLEVSVLSQWTAVALALELVFFARVWRMAFYATILVACFAGTGLLLVAMTAPVLLGRVRVRTMATIFVVALIGLTVAIKIHWYEMVSSRFNEYQKAGASANERFVAPIDVMFAEFEKPGFVFVGEGPGAISKDEGNTWWVVAKIAYEYGVFPTLTFCAFLIFVLFAGAPSSRLAYTYVMLMNFMGGFIIPIWPLLIFMLGGMFRFKESHGRRKAGADGGGESGLEKPPLMFDLKTLFMSMLNPKTSGSGKSRRSSRSSGGEHGHRSSSKGHRSESVRHSSSGGSTHSSSSRSSDGLSSGGHRSSSSSSSGSGSHRSSSAKGQGSAGSGSGGHRSSGQGSSSHGSSSRSASGKSSSSSGSSGKSSGGHRSGSSYASSLFSGAAGQRSSSSGSRRSSSSDSSRPQPPETGPVDPAPAAKPESDTPRDG